MKTTNFITWLGVLLTVAVLAGCGGGGGGGTPPEKFKLTPQATKLFHFTWPDEDGESEYRLLEDPDGNSGYTLIATLPADTTSYDYEVSLVKRINARYILQACDGIGCNDIDEVYVSGTLVEATGYVKASNTEASDLFGYSLAMSGDGNTLAVGAWGEDSAATGINGSRSDNSAAYAGAVYVFIRDAGGIWSQQAYVKASNTEARDQFGYSLAISGDGNTLAVGAYGEDSAATGINGNQVDNSATNAGAVYIFTRTGSNWSQQAYVKASNTEAGDFFGWSVALSSDSNTLAVGAYLEDSAATGINGNQVDNSATNAGAVYIFTRNGTWWSQQAYVKASNTGVDDYLGRSVALSSDGNTVAVGAHNEDSAATDINGNQADNSATDAGAVYLY